MKTGKIIALCTSPRGGVPKYRVPDVYVAEHGFDGDYHCKPERRSFSKPGTFKPNTDRHVTIVAQEAIEAVNAKLGLSLGPGALGENILTSGLGDLSDVADGAVVTIKSVTGSVMLKVVEQNQPCKNLAPYHPLMLKEIYGRRGLLCAVTSGVGHMIVSGTEISIG
ncbi:MAG TPA: MOSC domain-containing protein [Candidatus Paceibacterota bacterium]|nr:MOSC domain-containing protein [Candidatus Paceibacterota bacterium]